MEILTEHLFCFLQIGTEHGVKTSPDFRDDSIDNSDLEFMCNYVKQRFPGVYSKPSIIESCMYTVGIPLNIIHNVNILPLYFNCIFK